MAEGEVNAGAGEGASDEQMALLQRIEAAGWESTGSIGAKTVTAAFYRRSDRLAVGFTETVYRLGLLDPDTLLGEPIILGEPTEADKEAARAEHEASTDGMPEPPEKPAGFRVEKDTDTDELVITYEGPRNERFDRFVEDMLTWGGELETRQTEALDHEPALTWAVLESRRQERKLARLEEEHWAGADIEPISKQRIFAEVVTLALDSAVRELGDRAPQHLEAMFAWVVQQQVDRAAEAGVSEVSDAPDFDLLAGLSRGINLELVRIRELAAN